MNSHDAPNSRKSTWLKGIFTGMLFSAGLAVFTAALPSPGICAAGDEAIITKGTDKTPVVTMKEMDILFRTTFESELAKLDNTQRGDALNNLTKDGTFQKQFFDRGQWDTTAAIAEMAKKAKLDESDDYKAMSELIKMQILAKMYTDKVIMPEVDKVTVDQKEIDDFYAKNKELLFNGWRSISQIVVKTKDEADKLYTQLEKTPAGFADAARANSIDEATKGDGGYVGKITKTNRQNPEEQPSTLPEVEAAAFSTPKGKISKPVETRNGWYIIIVEDVSATDYPDLNDELRAKLKPSIEQQKKNDVMQKMIADMQTAAGIKINEDLIPKIGESWLKEEKAKLDKAAPPAPVPAPPAK